MAETLFSNRQTEAPAKGPLSVSAALEIAKVALESLTLSIVGEISDLSDNPRYKAVYFTLADEGSALPCLMWRSSFDRLGVQLKSGMQVEVRGRFSLYSAKGRMQFDVKQLTLAGEGQLRAQVAALAAKLKLQGLMDASRKHPLPAVPEKIALVTSPRGKAVHDVLRTLHRRYPLARVLLFGVGVEGKDAAAGLIKALKAAEESEAEVILLVRGGGSYEDLMPFNDEELARTIADIHKPIITGIGHEPDTSIADMVSSLRASTPTAAAEAAAPDVQDLLAQLSAQQNTLTHAVKHKLEYLRHELIMLERSEAFAKEDFLLSSKMLELELTAERLESAIPVGLATARDSLKEAARRLNDAKVACMQQRSFDLQRHTSSLLHRGGSLLQAYNTQVSTDAARLESLSPLAVLSRGYSLSFSEQGSVIRSVTNVHEHDAIRVQLNDGVIAAMVTGLEHKETSK